MMMNKRILTAVMAFFLAFSAQAQTMRSLWITMPDSLVPYLNASTRTSMVDMMGSGMDTNNLLSGQSRVDTLTADYLKATLTEASTIELKRFATAQGDSAIAVVNTFYGSEPESRLSFYSTSWQLLAANISADAAIQRPDTMDEETYETLQLMIDPEILAYQLSPDNATMAVAYSLPMLSEAEKKRVRAILQEKKYNLASLLLKEVK